MPCLKRINLRNLGCRHARASSSLLPAWFLTTKQSLNWDVLKVYALYLKIQAFSRENWRKGKQTVIDIYQLLPVGKLLVNLANHLRTFIDHASNQLYQISAQAHLH